MKKITRLASLGVLFGLSVLDIQAQALIRSYNTPVFYNGHPLLNPWAGGLNSCQFSRIDLNQDGIEDLFIFDRIGNRISTFINLSQTPGEIHYKYTREFNDAFPVGLKNWVLLRDFNCDGKKDIVANAQSGIKIWKNNSTPETGLAFELLDTGHPGNLIWANYDFGGSPFDAPLFCIGLDIPSIVDYDGDGDMDFFSYTESSATVYYFKNMQVELGSCDEPVYVCANRCHGMFRESPESFDIYWGNDFVCDFNVANPRSDDENLYRHTGGTLLSIDLDQNGVLDLVCGDVTEPYLIAVQMVDVANGADSAVAITYDFPASFSNTLPIDMNLFPAAFYEDVDNDGVRDLLVSPNAVASVEDKKSIGYYKNRGFNDLPDFEWVQNDFLQNEMLDFGLCAYPVVFDMDGDGLKDLIVANRESYEEGVEFTSRLWVFKNTGTVDAPVFAAIDNNWLNIPEKQWKSVYPAFGDLDGDGDDDLLLGDLNGVLHHYTNAAAGNEPPNFVLQPDLIMDDTGTILDVGQFATPQILDINGDGLNDLMIGEKNGNINYYENTGTLTSPVFHLVEDTVGKIVATSYLGIFGYSVPHFFKGENDEWNLLLGTETGQINHYDQIAENISGQFHLVTLDYAGIREGNFAAVCLADMNNDGLNDLFYGQIGGGLAYYQTDTDVGMKTFEPQEKQEKKIKVFPNPASRELIIECPDLSDAADVQVLNITGQQMGKKTMTARRISWDVSEWANGIYFLQIIGKNFSATQRFMVLSQ